MGIDCELVVNQEVVAQEGDTDITDEEAVLECACKTTVDLYPTLSVDRNGCVVWAGEEVEVRFAAFLVCVGRCDRVGGPCVDDHCLSVDGLPQGDSVSTRAPVVGKDYADADSGLGVG